VPIFQKISPCTVGVPLHLRGAAFVNVAAPAGAGQTMRIIADRPSNIPINNNKTPRFHPLKAVAAVGPTNCSRNIV
jgi:hypothetical protein